MENSSNWSFFQIINFKSFKFPFKDIAMIHLLILLVMVVGLYFSSTIFFFSRRQFIADLIKFIYTWSILFIMIFFFIASILATKPPMYLKSLFELEFIIILTVAVVILTMSFIKFGLYNKNEHNLIAIYTLFITYLNYFFILSIFEKSKFELPISLIVIAFANSVWFVLLNRVSGIYSELDNKEKIA